MADPKEIFSIKKRASEYQSKGEYAKAAKELEKLLPIEGAADEVILQKLGELYKKIGDKRKAVHYYRESAKVYEKLESYSHIIALYKRILEIDPSQKDLHLNVAEAYFNKNMITEGSKHILSYIEYLSEQGKVDEIFEYYEKLMEINPENITLKKQIAEEYVLYKRYKDAWRIYREVLTYFEERGLKEKIQEIKEELENIEMIIGEEVSKEELEKEFEQKITTQKKGDEGNSEEEKEFLSVEDLLKQHDTKRIGIRKSPARTVKKPSEEIKKQREIEKPEEMTSPLEEKIPPYSPEAKIKPKGWASRVDMGDMYWELGDKDAAIEEYYAAAEGYFKDGDMMNAFSVFKKIAEYNTLDLKARQKLVQIAQSLKNKNLLVESLLDLAECLYQRGDKEKAKVWYLQILKRADPDNREARERLAILDPEILEKLKKEKIPSEPIRVPEEEKITEEIEVIEEIKEQIPQKTEEEFVDLGDMIRQEIEKKEEEEKPLSLEEEIMKQIKESIHKHAEEGDPKERFELGIAMRDMGLYEEAISHLKYAARDEKLRQSALEQLGMIFLEINQPSLAIENFEYALQIGGGKKETIKSLHYHLALAYERIGDFLNALAHYKSLYEKDPSLKEVKNKINELEKNIKTQEDKRSKRDRISFV